ncbi:hypothetical protein F0H33_12170 [Xanthomonas translucens pv. undulosa]|nr:hypothetical protein F0H33_12170 [Xanthomonas translucens pv. undulosa]
MLKVLWKKQREAKAKAKAFALGRESLFFARAKKSNQKKARPASRLPRCALQVRVHDGDSRKGHPAPAANGAHPCAPPLRGFSPPWPPLRKGTR